MTKKHHASCFAALRELEESLDRHRRAQMADHARHEHVHRPRHKRIAHRARAASAAAWWRIRGGLRRPIIRKLIYGSALAAGAFMLCVGGLWWRLSTGPIELNLATPWLATAIEQNIGSRHKVEVGGTQIEHDENGHTSLRIRDILIRDADGAIVASAPKAEVAVSGTSLLMGQLSATRVSLVGAELAVRIETDGQVTVSTGAERRPLTVTSSFVKAVPAQAPQQDAEPAQAGSAGIVGLLAWIDKMAGAGLESDGLGEIGLKNGSLTVDDKRTGKQWTFEHINFSVNRVRGGGIVFSLGAEDVERPWLLSASVTPIGYRRAIQIEARQVSTRDLLLALRLDEGQFQADLPISATLRAELGPDSMPQLIEGRIFAASGTVGDPGEGGSFRIDKAEATLDWDAMRRSLVMPFQILAGGNRITLLSQFEAPREAGDPWRVTLTGGSIVLASVEADQAPLVLNRILLRAKYDLATRRLELEQGEIGSPAVSLALSGNADFSGSEPRLAGGFAGTQMTGLAAKRIWPAFIAPKVRDWVLDHFQSGAVERIVIASNAPMETLKEGGRPMPDEGLSVEVVVSNAVIQPIDSLPAIREAELTARITGRSATVSVARGIVELPSGRKLTLSNGVFEIPDHFPKTPPARARFRIDGPVQAAAEFLALDRLRDISGSPVDPAASRGNVSGQVTLGLPIEKNPPPGATTYTINLDLSNFGADKMMLGQKLEAQTLRVTANNQGYQIKGDVKINGTPAQLDYRKTSGDPEAEIRIQATLDDAGRARFGFDTNGMMSGPVPVKLSGRVTAEKEARLAVDADLTQANVDNLLPGWSKPAGKPARATFNVVNKPQSTRFEDLVLDGSGSSVRGNVELDDDGNVLSANFPTFAVSDGDKATLKAERGPDGALRVTMRGDVYDARNFVKSIMSGRPDHKPQRAIDLDLDIRLGAVAGFNGEALRGIELKMARRGGQIRSLALNSKIGREAAFIADLRARAGTPGRQVVYFETADAGALLRFTDTYSRMNGGQMWVALDPPAPDQAPQEGLLNIRDFTVQGEAALDRVVPAGQSGARSAVAFSRMRVDFTRSPGKLAVREGVLRGPTVGATIDGQIDYARSEVRMRGTFVPLYGLNNAFGQLPIVGLFLGGSNEGLVGITYEVVGTPSAPVLRVNPISAVAPGLLRKFFEFPGGERTTPDTSLNASR